MSDNVPVHPGGSTFIATDEVGGVQYQRVKIAVGADGSAADNDSTHPIYVQGTDNGPAWTTVWGVSAAPFTSADQHSAVASVTDAPTSGQKIVVDDILVSVDTAMNVTFKIETAGTVIYGPFYLPSNGTMQFTPRGKGRKLATADKKLQVLTSVSGNIMVDVSYHSEA